jgi:hypothetical protein
MGTPVKIIVTAGRRAKIVAGRARAPKDLKIYERESGLRAEAIGA